MERDNIFVQISKSNLANNGREAVLFQGGTLTEESFIRQNNIHGNNGSTMENVRHQVRTFNRQDIIDLSENYWEFVSDPQLGQTREVCFDEAIEFTGFAPEPIEDAGPIFEDLSDPVKLQTYEVQQAEEL